MQPDERDVSYLWDMLEGARTVRDFTAGVGFQQFIDDRKLQMAIERAVEIVGEAARRVSDVFQETHPEIPWRGIIAQRNVLVHEYGEIKQERMWIVASKRIPELIMLLEQLSLPAPPPAPEPEVM